MTQSEMKDRLIAKQKEASEINKELRGWYKELGRYSPDVKRLTDKIDNLESEIASLEKEIEQEPDKTALEWFAKETDRDVNEFDDYDLHVCRVAEAYARQSQEINLRDELIKYDRSYWGQRGDSEKIIDEYLNQK